MNNKSAFRNQRVRFRNYSPPYGDKVTFDPATPSEGVPPRGGLPSRKNGRVIRFWTAAEYAAIVLFEATPAILAYEERPERLKFRDGPSWLFYVPHFRVSLESGPIIVELSSEGMPGTERQQLVAEMAAGHYASRGIRFVELSHAIVRAKARTTDAHVILKYLSVAPSTADYMRASDALARGPASIADIEVQSGISQGCLLAMVRRGELAVAGPGPVSRGSILARVDWDGRA